MKASIIVITRNRSHSIGETLDALTKQDCRDREILVVDSSDPAEAESTAKRVAQSGAKYIFEPRRGQALARNTGIRAASGDVIAFTDDDCIPAADWLSQKLRDFEDRSVWACTGRVMQHERGDASELFEEVAGQDLGQTRRVFTKDDLRFGPGVLLGNALKVFAKHMKSGAPVPWCLGHGSSMAFAREAFRQNGGFDERYGWGNPIGGCEDIEILYRTLMSGHSVVYEPAAVIRHKHRFSAEEVFKTRYIYSYAGAGFMRHKKKSALMVFQFWGRLLQLLIKTGQYKVLRNERLGKSFSSDLRGFLDGWAAYRKFAREGRFKPGTEPTKL